MIRKIGISLPEDVLQAIDRVANEEGRARSAMIAAICARYLEKRRLDQDRREIDALFSDPDFAAEQLELAKAGARSLARTGEPYSW